MVDWLSDSEKQQADEGGDPEQKHSSMEHQELAGEHTKENEKLNDQGETGKLKGKLLKLLKPGKPQVKTSTAKFLWAAQDKRFKKFQKGTNRNLWGPSGTFRNCLQATVTTFKLL